MSDKVFPDTRQSHWWGILFPRPTLKATWASKIVSVLTFLPTLLVGLLIASLHILTLPILIVVLLFVHVVKGDARQRSRERSERFMQTNAS